MHQFEAAYSAWVIKYRWAIIPITLILMLIAASGVKNLEFKSDYRIFFGPDNLQRIAFEELENTYVKNDSLMIVVAPPDANVFTSDNLAIIEEITEHAWQTPYSNRVDSITNFQYTETDHDDLIVRDLVKNARELSDADIARIKRIALNEPLINGSLVRDDARVSGLFINVQLPGDDPTTENAAIINFARQLAADIESKHPGTRIYLTGMVMMNNAFLEATTNDLKTLIPLSVMVMIILLMIFVGSVIGTLASVVVFASSIAGALGLAGYAGFPLTPVSASSPIIILTVAIANCVHILVSFLVWDAPSSRQTCCSRRKPEDQSTACLYCQHHNRNRFPKPEFLRGAAVSTTWKHRRGRGSDLTCVVGKPFTRFDCRTSSAHS